MYSYSERPGTLAARRYADDVNEATKQRRLAEIIEVHRHYALQSNQKELGTTQIVLVEGFSKKSNNDLSGRTDTNKFVVFPKGNAQKGDFVKVRIVNITSGTLIGEILEII
jgi:tRNA-2-methylthio-N6-dimethylallyladenosine synthase